MRNPDVDANARVLAIMGGLTVYLVPLRHRPDRSDSSFDWGITLHAHLDATHYVTSTGDIKEFPRTVDDIKLRLELEAPMAVFGCFCHYDAPFVVMTHTHSRVCMGALSANTTAFQSYRYVLVLI